VTFKVLFDISVTNIDPSGIATGPSGAPTFPAKIPEAMYIS
jgi:hypothetical protein